MNATALKANSIVPLGTALLGATLLGCVSSQANLPRLTMPALEPEPQVVEPGFNEAPVLGDGEVASLSTEEPVGFTAAPQIPDSQPLFPPEPGPELVSLWGDELIREASNGAAQHDGSGNLRQLSFATEGSTFDPDVNRTGDRLVFASTRHRATADLYLQSTTGTTVTQLTSGPAHDIMPDFDPTGTRISFASDRSGNWDLYVMDLDGGRPVQLTHDHEPELHPTWSPDGRTIAYCRFGNQTGRWEIWVVDVDNPSTPSFLTFGVFPQWSPDIATSKLLFQRARERGSRYHSIWTIDYVGGEARHPTEIISAGNAALINPA
ncbi:MAG: TolB family protein, partial [Planctomycetota bacterium]